MCEKTLQTCNENKQLTVSLRVEVSFVPKHHIRTRIKVWGSDCFMIHRVPQYTGAYTKCPSECVKVHPCTGTESLYRPYGP
jgi:hypothetical protein